MFKSSNVSECGMSLAPQEGGEREREREAEKERDNEAKRLLFWIILQNQF